jgi:hypothetical protein
VKQSRPRRAATKGPVRLAKAASPSYAVERFRLDNGLRVVLSPDSSSPVVAVAVYYDVGMRSEPQGRTGFAHLFEHLMFQGSASLGKTEHFTHVQGNGGSLNGSTHVDYTNYYEVMPSAATELALFLEADRMRSVAVTQENLDNQIAVVQNEIRVNVINRPYGGFPWLVVPPVLFDDFANSHNGYGDFVDLESSTLEDAQGFFERYYAPGQRGAGRRRRPRRRAGDRLGARALRGHPAAPVPERPSFSETLPPPSAAPRCTTAWAPHRRRDRVARAGPGRSATYLPYVVLAEVLTDGDASRLQERMLLEDRSATHISGYLGLLATRSTRGTHALPARGAPPGGDAARAPCSAPSSRSDPRWPMPDSRRTSWTARWRA